LSSRSVTSLASSAFDADQSAGLSKLALTFALPASPFVGMTDIRKDLLLKQGRLVLALILSHAGLFVFAWLLLRVVKSLSGTASIIYAPMLATSATPVFGLAVLRPDQRRGRGTRGTGN
jgi:predicted permease